MGARELTVTITGISLLCEKPEFDLSHIRKLQNQILSLKMLYDSTLQPFWYHGTVSQYDQ